MTMAIMANPVYVKQLRSFNRFYTQRNGVLGLADKLLVLQGGQATAFGPRQEVLARLGAMPMAPARPAAVAPAASPGQPCRGRRSPLRPKP